MFLCEKPILKMPQSDGFQRQFSFSPHAPPLAFYKESSWYNVEKYRMSYNSNLSSDLLD